MKKIKFSRGRHIANLNNIEEWNNVNTMKITAQYNDIFSWSNKSKLSVRDSFIYLQYMEWSEKEHREKGEKKAEKNVKYCYWGPISSWIKHAV